MSNLPRWVRTLILLVIIAVAVVILFQWVFPWVESTWYNPAVE